MGKSMVSKSGNDRVMTPLYLAREIIGHFRPAGRRLDPCSGTGNFLKAMKGADWFEIDRGRDFMAAEGHWDWIVTNPPYSKFKDFLEKSFGVADNVVFLIPLIHVWTKARLRLLQDKNFGIKEIYCVDTPKEFPQMGFQMGCVHFAKGFIGKIKFTMPKKHK